MMSPFGVMDHSEYMELLVAVLLLLVLCFTQSYQGRCCIPFGTLPLHSSDGCYAYIDIIVIFE